MCSCLFVCLPVCMCLSWQLCLPVSDLFFYVSCLNAVLMSTSKKIPFFLWVLFSLDWQKNHDHHGAGTQGLAGRHQDLVPGHSAALHHLQDRVQAGIRAEADADHGNGPPLLRRIPAPFQRLLCRWVMRMHHSGASCCASRGPRGLPRFCGSWVRCLHWGWPVALCVRRAAFAFHAPCIPKIYESHNCLQQAAAEN